MPAAHPTTTETERALCEEMDRQGLPHAHRSLHFRVRQESGELESFDPDIVVHRGPILFLIVCLADDAAREARIRLLTRFLDQHSPEIVLVVLASSAAVREVPAEAYDEIYADTESAAVVGRIREQDPQGMVRPFAKLHPRGK